MDLNTGRDLVVRFASYSLLIFIFVHLKLFALACVPIDCNCALLPLRALPRSGRHCFFILVVAATSPVAVSIAFRQHAFFPPCQVAVGQASIPCVSCSSVPESESTTFRASVALGDRTNFRGRHSSVLAESSVVSETSSGARLRCISARIVDNKAADVKLLNAVPSPRCPFFLRYVRHCSRHRFSFPGIWLAKLSSPGSRYSFRDVILGVERNAPFDS